MITTVHDLAVFDVPWAFPARRVVGERLIVARSVRAADVVIAVSAFTAERVKAILQREAVVIPEAPSDSMRIPGYDEIATVRKRYRLPERYVLHVGTIEPRKNVWILADACQRVKIPLVIAGNLGWKMSMPRNALILGFVPQRDLPALYGAATIAAYVSVYEGFGLPPLEAMACGCPVLSTRVPSVELVEGGVFIVDSPTIDSLTHGLSELTSDNALRSEIARTGIGLVQRLTWDLAAQATASVYQQLGIPMRRTWSSSTSAMPDIHVQVTSGEPSGENGRSLLLRKAHLWNVKPFVEKPGHLDG